MDLYFVIRNCGGKCAIKPFLFCDQWRGRSLSNKQLAPLKADLKVKLKDMLHTHTHTHTHTHKGHKGHSVGARGSFFFLTCKGQTRFIETTHKNRGVLSVVKVKERWKDEDVVCSGWRSPWLSRWEGRGGMNWKIKRPSLQISVVSVTHRQPLMVDILSFASGGRKLYIKGWIPALPWHPCVIYVDLTGPVNWV